MALQNFIKPVCLRQSLLSQFGKLLLPVPRSLCQFTPPSMGCGLFRRRCAFLSIIAGRKIIPIGLHTTMINKNQSCTLYGARCSVIECCYNDEPNTTRNLHRRPNLTDVSPHTGRGALRFANYAHGPFFIMPSQVDRKQLVLQTVIIAVAAVVIVNLFPRRGRK